MTTFRRLRSRTSAWLLILGVPLALLSLFNDSGDDGGAGDGDAGGGSDDGDKGAGKGGDAGAGGGSDKTFTQADVDRIVQDRVARAKGTAPADYEDLKVKAAEYDKLADANKTELEKAQEAARKATEERDAAIATSRETAKQTAVLAAAATAGVVKPEQIYALLPKDAVTIGDDGQVTGADDAVKAFIADNPHFVGQKSNGSGSADGGARGGSAPGQLTRDDLKTMSPEEIVKAKEDGRLKTLLGGGN